MPSRRSRTVRRLALPFAGVALGCLAWGLFAGCQQGRAPYDVIPAAGPPTQFLPPPPAGVTPGTSHETGLIYRFDRTQYALFQQLAGTDPRFVRRDSVLALIAAGAPNAPRSLLLRPDLSDPTLAAVYSDPRLFAFKRSTPDSVGFFAGRRVPNAAAYLPLQIGNWWDTVHNQREWTITDSIAGTGSAPTAAGMPAYQLVSTARARIDLAFQLFKPSPYVWTMELTSDPTQGILWHAWTLVSERVSAVARSNPDRQRNPRFLWLSIESLGQSADQRALVPVTVDQCLDGLDAHLDLYPVRASEDSLREGDIFTTWTYITVPTEALRQRLNEEAAIKDPVKGGRCGTPIAAGRDTLKMFPTGTFSLLARFTVRTERIIDQIEVKPGDVTLGLYPRTPKPASIVEFVVQMSVRIESVDIPVQYLELWYMKDFGPVVTGMGVNPKTRSASRLRSCSIGGIDYPRDNPYFYYND